MIKQANTSSLDIIFRLRDVIEPSADAWLVGGSVRDQLAGKLSHDIDLIFPFDPRQIARQAADRLGGNFFTLDDSRGMYRILITENGQTDVVDFGRFQAETLEEDLKNRDFTINAVAYRLHNPTDWKDPLGGRQDLKDRLLRPCSEHAFINDPVRTIRAARMALGFNLHMVPGVIQMIREASLGLKHVSAERKRDEFFKLLDSPHPASAIRLLDSFNVLPQLIPELIELKGVQQSLPHTMNVWEHTLSAVKHLDQLLDLFIAPEGMLEDGGNLMLGLTAGKLGKFRQDIQKHYNHSLNPFRTRKSLGLLGALLHDIGKPVTAKTGEDGRIHFYGHQTVGAEITRRIGQSLALSEVEVDGLSVMTESHMKPHFPIMKDTLPSRRNVYRYYRSAKDFGVDTCFLSLADSLSRTDTLPEQEAWTAVLDKISVYLEGWFDKRETWVQPPRLISGDDIMRHFSLEPGKIIGDVLDKLQEAQASGEISTREEALELAKITIHNHKKESDE